MPDVARPASSHFPGFDGLRLAAALSVIFSHAFLIATGSEDAEPLVRLLGPHNIIGLYGVFAFFITSGFLLARSLDASGDPIAYAVNRSLRLLPALWVCILLTVLVAGPVFTALHPGSYFAHAETRTYLQQGVMQLIDSGEGLPGLFNYVGPLAGTVNGALWSLPFEALSYVTLIMFWLALRQVTLAALALAAVAVLSRLFPAAGESLIKGIWYTLPYFTGGVVMYLVYRRYGMHRWVALLSGLALVLSVRWDAQQLAFAVFGAYLIVFVGARSHLGNSLVKRIGDCSYGLYLFGWPVEQILKQVTGTGRPLVLFALAVPATFLLAYASCHLVEAPAMRARRRVSATIRRAVDRTLAFAPASRPMANLVARWTFVVTAALILISRDRMWWYVLRSVGIMITLSIVGALIVVAVGRGLVAWRSRPTAPASAQ